MRHHYYDRAFCAGLALLPVLGVAAPRALCFAPGVLALIFSGLWVWAYRTKPPVPKRALGWIGAVLALAALSSLWAADPADALGRVGRIALVLLPGAMLIGLAGASGLRSKMLLAIPAAYAAAAAALAVEVWTGMAFHRLVHHVEKTYAFPDMANRAVVVLVLLLPATLVLLHNAAGLRPQIKTAIAAIAAVSLGLILIKTGSQSVQVAVPVMLGAAFLFPVRRKFMWRALALVIAALIVASPWLAIWLFQTLPPLIGPHAEAGTFMQQSYALARLEIWDFVARHILKNPLCGYGVEATRSIAFDTRQLYYQNTSVLHPHNIMLQLWIEYGVIGALGGSLFIAKILQYLRSETTGLAQRAGLAALAGTLSIGAMTYGLWQGWLLGLFLSIAAFTVLAQHSSAAEASTGPSPS